MIIHVVKRGETLSDIARLFGVTISQIVETNELENPNVILIGQSLIIPGTSRTHIVKPGETLKDIAKLYGTTTEEFIKLNNIQNPDVIYVGTAFIIPNHKPTIDVNAYTINMGEEGARKCTKLGNI